MKMAKKERTTVIIPIAKKNVPLVKRRDYRILLDAKIKCIEPASECPHKRIINGKEFCALPSPPEPFENQCSTRLKELPLEELYKQIREEIELEIAEAEAEVDLQEQQSLRKELKTELREEIKQEIRKEIEEEIRNELQNKSRPEIIQEGKIQSFKLGRK